MRSGWPACLPYGRSWVLISVRRPNLTEDFRSFQLASVGQERFLPRPFVLIIHSHVVWPVELKMRRQIIESFNLSAGRHPLMWRLHELLVIATDRTGLMNSFVLPLPWPAALTLPSCYICTQIGFNCTCKTLNNGTRKRKQMTVLCGCVLWPCSETVYIQGCSKSEA
jgi:hypothetical protein